MEYVELATLLLVAANTFLAVRHDVHMKHAVRKAVAEVLDGR